MFHRRLELKEIMNANELTALYIELNGYFQTEAPVSTLIKVSDIGITPTGLTVKNHEMSINDRAESVLNSRLGIGKMREILPEDQFELILPAINNHLKQQEEQMVIKTRRGQIQGVVSDQYREIPYTDTLTIMQHIGAHPIRVFHNDYTMKMQAIIPEYKLCPADDANLNLGVQLKTSDMGAGALAFDVFLYRWACANGMIMGKKSIGAFRTIHVKSLAQAENDTRRELNRVLTDAAEKLEVMVNSMLNKPADDQRVINFLQKQPIGKKALAYIADQLPSATNMWDTINLLTEAGHNQQFSQSLQFAFEQAAGELFALAA